MTLEEKKIQKIAHLYWNNDVDEIFLTDEVIGKIDLYIKEHPYEFFGYKPQKKDQMVLRTIRNLFDFEKDNKKEPHYYDIPISHLGLDTFKEYCTPMFGAENVEPFGKYGYTFTGICDGWEWKDEELAKAPELDLWKMLAISETYWRINYERWYHEVN